MVSCGIRRCSFWYLTKLPEPADDSAETHRQRASGNGALKLTVDDSSSIAAPDRNERCDVSVGHHRSSRKLSLTIC